MGIEITSGFDSQIINVVQIVPAWQKCKDLSAFDAIKNERDSANIVSDFGKPTGKLVKGAAEYAVEANLKGFLGASYSLGAILSLPFVPYVNQKFGRRWSIMFGSCISVVGAILQGFANGSRLIVISREEAI